MSLNKAESNEKLKTLNEIKPNKKKAVFQKTSAGLIFSVTYNFSKSCNFGLQRVTLLSEQVETTRQQILELEVSDQP